MAESLGTDPGPGISGYGTTLQGATTGVLGNINRIAIDGQEADEIEISTMNSPGRVKQFIAGMIDPKAITLDLIYEDKQTTVIISRIGKTNESWTIVFPDGSTYVVPGFLKKVGAAIPMNDKITQTVIIRCSGLPVFNSASGSP